MDFCEGVPARAESPRRDFVAKKKIEFSNSLQSYSPSTDGMVTGSRVRRVGAQDKGGEGRVLCQEGGVRCCYGVLHPLAPQK